MIRPGCGARPVPKQARRGKGEARMARAFETI